MKKFFKNVEVNKNESGFYSILLDEKELLTPAKKAFEFKNEKLASLVAEEWAAQGEKINPYEMPITRFVNTSLDRVANAREVYIDELNEYLDTDLLLYRAKEGMELRVKQEKDWQPILDWVKQEFDAEFIPTDDLVPMDQEEADKAKIINYIKSLSDFELTAAYLISANTGSPILGVAMLKERLTHDEAYNISLLDELWQAELWGVDEEAEQKRNNVRKELIALSDFIKAVK